MNGYRTAGILLLLTALATAISVPARLSAGADLPTPEESLAAIGAASVAYGIGGAARLVGGLALLAASVPIWRAMGQYHPSAITGASVLLAVSGIASAVSGVAAISLSALAPGGMGAAEVAVGQTEDTLFAIRSFAGTLGFTLAGLGLVAMAPALWWMGGLMRGSAPVAAILGVAMLFIWVDAATVVHRITGIGFLIWLIVAGLWLAAGWAKPQLRSASPSLP